jgi:hypothetical protein
MRIVDGVPWWEGRRVVDLGFGRMGGGGPPG